MNKTWYQRKINLDDNWLISIICTQDISYGHADLLFECAMVEPDGDVNHDSVTGHLDFDQVAEYIKKAKEIHNDKTR
jgi:hypothetical protein